jgi:hypothetical protein
MVFPVPTNETSIDGVLRQQFIGFNEPYDEFSTPAPPNWMFWIVEPNGYLGQLGIYNSGDRSIDLSVDPFLGSPGADASQGIDIRNGWFFEETSGEVGGVHSGYSNFAEKIYFGCKIDFADWDQTIVDGPNLSRNPYVVFSTGSFYHDYGTVFGNPEPSDFSWYITAGRGGASCRANVFWTDGSGSDFFDVYVGSDIGDIFEANGNSLWLGFGVDRGPRTQLNFPPISQENGSVTFMYSTDGVTYTTVYRQQGVFMNKNNETNPFGVSIALSNHTGAYTVTASLSQYSAWYPNGILDVRSKLQDGEWVESPPTAKFVSPQDSGEAPPPTGGGFADIVTRAETGWPFEGVPYSQSGTFGDGAGPYIDGYRRDCSGFAAMAAGIPPEGPNTVSFVSNGWITRINWSQLVAGDFVGHCGPGTAGDAGHIMVVVSVDTIGGTYDVYEQNGVGLGPHHNTYTIGDDLGNSFAPYRLTALLS